MKKFVGILMIILFFAGSVCGVVYGIKYAILSSNSYTQEEYDQAYDIGYDEAFSDREEIFETIKNLQLQISQKDEKISSITALLEQAQAKNEVDTETIESLESQLSQLESDKLSLQNQVTTLEGLLESYEEIAEGTHQVTFYNGDVIHYVKAVIDGQTIDVSIPTPTKEGHTFSGWSLNEQDIVDISSISITEDASFYAIFTPNIYEVTMNYSYYTSMGNKQTSSLTQDVAYGSSVETIELPSGVDEINKVVSYTLGMETKPIGFLYSMPITSDTEITLNLDVKDLEDMSWTTIANISQQFGASKLLSVGDEKSVTLTNGEELTFVILGIGHDTARINTGSLNIYNEQAVTFGLKGLMEDTHNMSSANTNVGGYPQSDMYEYLETIFDLLPSDLQAVIHSTTKTTLSGGNNNSSTTSFESKLWLFSEVELTGTTEAGYSAEGSQYEYYKTNSIAKTSEDGTVTHYWLRTTYIPYSSNYKVVTGDGIVSTTDANISYGVCFGFCI